MSQPREPRHQIFELVSAVNPSSGSLATRQVGKYAVVAIELREIWKIDPIVYFPPEADEEVFCGIDKPLTP